MKESQRPREKALKFGLESLSDVELLALILQSGNRKRDVMDIANDVLKKSNYLENIFNMHANSLIEIQGISDAKALQLLAGLELAKRALKVNAYQKSISSPEDVMSWFEMEFGVLKQEHFVALYLDTKGKIIRHHILFIGTLNESSVHPREIFKEAFLENAYSIILAHNHPSGDPTPSKQDIDFTDRVISISNMMGIPVLDHVIIGKHAYFSFKQENTSRLKVK